MVLFCLRFSIVFTSALLTSAQFLAIKGEFSDTAGTHFSHTDFLKSHKSKVNKSAVFYTHNFSVIAVRQIYLEKAKGI